MPTAAAEQTPAPGRSPEPPTPADRDHAAITETITAIARGADLHQWDLVRAAFAPDVVLDYGTPEHLTPDAVVGRWRPLLGAFDATQHTLSDVQVHVDGDRATAASHFQATHVLRGAAGDGDVWVLTGRYEHRLARTAAGWQVTAMRMVPGASSGNATLLDQARARAETPASAGAAPAGALRPGPNRVTFASEGDTLVGTLFLPPSYAAGTRLPLVVVTGSWTTVKEQMPAVYARRLAARGYAALTFDFRGFGESQGAPREYESPARKSVDIRNAAAFARTLPVVDGERVGGLAVCASAGYMARAIADGAPLRAFVTVAAWLHDPGTVGQVYGGAEGVAERLALAAAARARYERTGVVDAADYVAAYDPAGHGAAMFFPVDYYARPERGAVPQWANRFPVMAWADWLTYDALAAAPGVAVPTLLVHSDDSAYPDNVRRFHAALAGPKGLFWTQGQHIDFYDRDPFVATAVAAAADHFSRALAEPPSGGPDPDR